jgi:hypothetical protein
LQIKPNVKLVHRGKYSQQACPSTTCSCNITQLVLRRHEGASCTSPLFIPVWPLGDGYGLPNQVIIPMREGPPTEGRNCSECITARHPVMPVPTGRCIDSVHPPAQKPKRDAASCTSSVSYIHTAVSFLADALHSQWFLYGGWGECEGVASWKERE